MLADRTNFNGYSPLRSQHISESSGGTKGGRPSRTSGVPNSAQNWSEVDKARLSVSRDEDEEMLRKIKEEKARIPKLISKFEEVFGTVEERTNQDTMILRKIAPDSKMNIPAKASEFLKQETGRLGEGYKKVRSQRDNLQRDLAEMQLKFDFVFEQGTQVLSRLKHEKAEALKKVHELEQKCLNDRLQSARTKAALGKEVEAVARAEAAVEEARKMLESSQKLRAEAEAREQNARKRAMTAEQIARDQSNALQIAKDKRDRMQKDLAEKERAQKEKMAMETLNWRQKVENLNRELDSLRVQLKSCTADYESTSASLNSCVAENRKKESMLEALKERATDAENKLAIKDGNVNLALQTLHQAQEFTENRLENQSQEKKRLELKIEELTSEKNVVVEKLYELNIVANQASEKAEQMSNRADELERKVRESESKVKSTEEAVESAKKELHVKNAKYSEAKETLDTNLVQLKEERAKYDDSVRELDHMQRREEQVENELSEVKAAFERLKSSPTKMQRILEEAFATENLRRKAGDLEQLKQFAQQLEGDLENAKKLLFESDCQRRTLLNEVQTLKGNIRVVARVRPPSSNSSSNGKKDAAAADVSKVVCSIDGMNLTLEVRGDQQRRGATSSQGTESHSFGFNRVFDTTTTQHAVFEEVAQFVQSALDGYKVCLFSYGQTGSGKTWTMTGDITSEENRGIIPRSVDLILSSICQMREKGWSYDVECSFIEIYNEKIRDLLADPKVEKGSKHEIQHRGGNIVVTGIKRVPVGHAEEVQLLLKHAERFRSVAATDKNFESSRSHSLFTIHLVGRNSDKGGAELLGSLNLCDLAGSERLKTSHATGDRLKETQAINTSLSALASVFVSLTQKAAYIPFRDSALTHILSPCLSGEGKTLMIVNISSDHDDAQETLCSLRFAQQVNKTELGKAKKQVREVPVTTSNTVSELRGRNNSQ